MKTCKLLKLNNLKHYIKGSNPTLSTRHHIKFGDLIQIYHLYAKNIGSEISTDCCVIFLYAEFVNLRYSYYVAPIYARLRTS